MTDTAARPSIALTNDDGIRSPGLLAAARALAPLGDVTIIAPAEQQSGTGRGLWGAADATLRPVPYEADGAPIRAYACAASPARVVLHALETLFADRLPDLLVAGINYGENLGYNVTLSGTIGAALQAASAGVPALAVSLQTDVAFHVRYGDLDWTTAMRFTTRFARALLGRQPPFDAHVVKVDVPDDATPETPWKTTRLSRREYFSVRMRRTGPDAALGDAVTGVFLDPNDLEPGSDIYAILRERVVSVTPLSLDLTARTPPEELEQFLRDNGADAPQAP